MQRGAPFLAEIREYGDSQDWGPASCHPSVSDSDIVKGCRMLAQKESILAGASSGGIIAAVKQMEPELTSGAVCAVILHDKGERYLDTVYSDSWIQSQFGRELLTEGGDAPEM